MARLQRKKAPSVKRKKRQLEGFDEGGRLKETAVQRKPQAYAGAESPKKPAPPQRGGSGSGWPGKSYVDQAIQFLREVKVELKKVTWPSRKQTLGSTLVVLILVMIISFFLGAVDIGLSSLVRLILN